MAKEKSILVEKKAPVSSTNPNSFLTKEKKRVRFNIPPLEGKKSESASENVPLANLSTELPLKRRKLIRTKGPDYHFSLGSIDKMKLQGPTQSPPSTLPSEQSAEKQSNQLSKK